ncbi:cAMP receptor protein [mine drainage metagenome]|uniref:cAMP receptor protein n=1 Tax=mine drainage metagenome TaxID=410659 RepID=A0A1J5RPF2_9ZZZZ
MPPASLEGITLFEELPAEALHGIAQACRWQRYAPGQLVFDRDSDTLDVYFVVKGTVRISSTVSPEREVALADVGAGQYFGEIAAIDRQRRTARVVALEESLLASLGGPAFVGVMRDHSGVALKVMGRLTRIVRDLDHRVIRLLAQSESQRVWCQLLKLSESDPVHGGGIIRDMPNHGEIATWAGTSRDCVARAIGDLARNGIVRRRTRGLVISDLDRLKLMAGED